MRIDRLELFWLRSEQGKLDVGSTDFVFVVCAIFDKFRFWVMFVWILLVSLVKLSSFT